METHELLRLVFKTAGHKPVASHLELSQGYIDKWTRPHKNDINGESGWINPLDRLKQIWECTKDHRLVDWVCELAGGFFVRNPRVSNGQPPKLLDEEHDVYEVSGDTLSLIAKCARDHEITEEESKKIRRQWEHEKSVKEHFAVCCEQKDFVALAKATELHLPQSSARARINGGNASGTSKAGSSAKRV